MQAIGGCATRSRLVAAAGAARFARHASRARLCSSRTPPAAAGGLLRQASLHTPAPPAHAAAAWPQAPHDAAPPPAEQPRTKRFRFRHFTLQHGGPCAHQMGTDAMLLGAWAQPPPHTQAVLDVGTGSGVLALMMAQKTAELQQQPGSSSSSSASHRQQQPAAVVHGIDIDAAAVAQAGANAAASPWSGRVHISHASLQRWAASSRAGPHQQQQQQYDLIITNPPFFLRSSKPAHSSRAAARHADEALPFSELAGCSARLLAPHGRLCVVLPVQEAQLFALDAAAAGLQLTRLACVFTRSSDAQPKRHLMCFAHADPSSSSSGVGDQQQQAAELQVERLVVMEQQAAAAGGGGDSSGWGFSRQYLLLTQDFHHPDLMPSPA